MRFVLLSIVLAASPCLSVAQVPPPSAPAAAARRDQNRPAIQTALGQLTAAYDTLGDIVSDCNGGNVLVRTCDVQPDAIGAPCKEPLASCATVAAYKSVKAAIASLRTSPD